MEAGSGLFDMTACTESAFGPFFAYYHLLFVLDVSTNMLFEGVTRLEPKAGIRHVLASCHGRWVERQRTLCKRKELDEKKVDALESIGFEWSLPYQRRPRNPVSRAYFDAVFDEMLLKVESFVKKNGHGRIPQRYEEDPELGIWCKNKRSQKRRGMLCKRRKNKG